MDSIFLPSPIAPSPPEPQHPRILNFAINLAQQALNPPFGVCVFSQAILPWEVALGMLPPSDLPAREPCAALGAHI